MRAPSALKPEYIIFAGVNGVGKSTFYHTFAWTDSAHPQRMSRVNSDEIIVASNGDWSSPQDQAKAAKLAVKAIRDLMGRRQSFNQETTLAGRSAIMRIKEALSLGYWVKMFYIGIDSPEHAQQRIFRREMIGGHGIDEVAVRRRYRESLANLSKAVRICDEVVVFDNTLDFVELARWSSGVLSWVGKLNQYGQWLIDAIRDESLWQPSEHGDYSETHESWPEGYWEAVHGALFDLSFIAPDELDPSLDE